MKSLASLLTNALPDLPKEQRIGSFSNAQLLNKQRLQNTKTHQGQLLLVPTRIQLAPLQGLEEGLELLGLPHFLTEPQLDRCHAIQQSQMTLASKMSLRREIAKTVGLD